MKSLSADDKFFVQIVNCFTELWNPDSASSFREQFPNYF